MANDADDRDRMVRLSSKELPGLAARVLTAGFMPPGVVGGAAEAIEFLELTSGNALLRLDTEKDTLDQTVWTPPSILVEGPGQALCDAHDVPSHYYAAGFGDWLAGLAEAHGAAAIGIRNTRQPHYLQAVCHFLAQHGCSSLILTHDDAGGTELCACLVENGRWVLARSRPDRLPAMLAGLPLSPTMSIEDLRRCCQSAEEWMEAAHCGDGLDLQPAGAVAEEGKRTALLIAIRLKHPAKEPGAHRSWPMADWNKIDAEALRAKKRKVLMEGWPVERKLWESLMAFAERGLIASSEQSRLGAG